MARGERILITKHGQPVAMLVPPSDDEQRPDVREVIHAMQELQKGDQLGERVTILESVRR